MNQTKLTGALLILSGVLAAQEPRTPNESTTPIFRITVTARTTKAINYQHRSGPTNIDFRGTDLLPLSHGEAKVESRQGYIGIDVEFRNLQPASKYGAEYLTYVLWAITPDGRTANLGEVLLNGTNSKLHVTTELQTFGLIVTAEPYYAVNKPSDLVVMENEVRADTKGRIEEIDAKYELLQRGQYQRLANPLALKLDRKQPLELYEARNAVQIARSMGADRYANDTLKKAENSLAQADAYQTRHAGRKPVAMMAREAVQTAEDSRAIAVKRQEDEALNAQREQSLQREATAENGRAAAQSDRDRVMRDAAAAGIKAQAESDRLTAEKDAQAAASSTEADRVKREHDAQMAAASADASRLKAENDASAAAAKTEADRLRIENDAKAVAAKTEADRLKIENDASATANKTEADRLKQENDSKLALMVGEADRLKRENEAQKVASQLELDSVAKQKAQLEADKVELRAQLLKQFNDILQTRDTARGLIVNMSDVLFDTGKFSLRPLAREKLAKVAGIVSGHPGLRLDVEGHTDSVGGDDYNQTLSEQRGSSVRDYLMVQGMPSASVTSKGFGKTQPVASNDTASGRQENRRVEIVISGDVIGTDNGTPVALR